MDILFSLAVGSSKLLENVLWKQWSHVFVFLPKINKVKHVQFNIMKICLSYRHCTVLIMLFARKRFEHIAVSMLLCISFGNGLQMQECHAYHQFCYKGIFQVEAGNQFSFACHLSFLDTGFREFECCWLDWLWHSNACLCLCFYLSFSLLSLIIWRFIITNSISIGGLSVRKLTT